MSIILDGTLGITSPAWDTVQGNLTTTGNTILGDASTDTLNVGNGGLVKDASGNVGIGTASPSGGGGGTILNVNGATAASFRLSNSSSADAADLFLTGSVAYLQTATAIPLVFRTNATERMRLDTSGNLLFNSGYGSVATAYGCRAWVNFNGTGTVAIRASGNVSSITDNGTGYYTVNFSTAMPDANYSSSFSLGIGSVPVPGVDNNYSVFTTVFNTGNISISLQAAVDDSSRDYAHITVAIFR